MTGKDIRVFEDFQTYVTTCTDGQLLGLACEYTVAVRENRFSDRTPFCYNALNSIESGINLFERMCITIASEIVKRVAFGTLSPEEYMIHSKMADAMRETANQIGATND